MQKSRAEYMREYRRKKRPDSPDWNEIIANMTQDERDAILKRIAKQKEKA